MKRASPLLQALRRDRHGGGALEFALMIPLWLLFFFGLAQVALVGWATAGLQNGLGEGARLATLWPRVSTAQIIAKVQARTFGVITANMATPVVTLGTANGVDYADISVRYNAQMPVFGLTVYTLRFYRRAYRS